MDPLYMHSQVKKLNLVYFWMFASNNVSALWGALMYVDYGNLINPFGEIDK